MTIAIIYPPTCDTTGPYLSVPILTAWLRSHNKKVLPIDANIEAYNYLLKENTLSDMLNSIRKLYRALDEKPSLNHSDQMKYVQLYNAMAKLNWVPDNIEDAVSVMRDSTGGRFFNAEEYEKAVITIEAGLKIISALYHPLYLDFQNYRTPFSLLSPSQIKADAATDKNPFHSTYKRVADRIKENNVSLAGISIAFPGQIQPGFSLAGYLRSCFTDIHITVGGPAITQILLRHDHENQLKILGPFDTAIIYEGEEPFLDLANSLERGEKPAGIINGSIDKPMEKLPAPDFDGLPLDLYFSPEPVLPYDPSRGCYWGKCSFCHYGLSSEGTAKYRERNINDIVNHLKQLSNRWGCKNFYFSQDAFLPETAHRLGLAIKEKNLDIHWSTDMRPEASLTPEMCADLKAGGALSMALGIESASPRLLKLIRKGITTDTMITAVKSLASAGIAVEAMCFNNFPTETLKDALATIEFIRENKKFISLFIDGRFGLSHGSRVALNPSEYGISEIWQVSGDEIGTGLFYSIRGRERSIKEQTKIDNAIDSLSAYWWLHDYPWAGSLSTVHTILWYEKRGRDTFRKSAKKGHRTTFSTPMTKIKSRYDIKSMEYTALENEAEIWQTLVYEHRAVSPERYNNLAAKFPLIQPEKR
ncbi:MAG: B12-binding domain-containing radical SAM protein [Desulfatiglans sp.]|jgi:hypothetical protein|nr:B12-binding domain-containing radical SAM protein [Desulfatiglans sp.]